MTFLNASLALAGALCVAAPIIIHLLFRRRRRPIEWGAMRFLLEAFRKQRRRLRLEQLLLLAARCLVVLLVGLALGRPILERAGVLGAGGARSVYLLVDNGLASGARDEQGRTALDRHKAGAAEVLAALGPSDRAGLIALGAPADFVVAPPSSNLAEVKGLLEALTPTHAAVDMAGAIERVRAEALARPDDRAREVALVVFSDFYTGSAETSAALPTLAQSGDAPSGAPRVRVMAVRPREQAAANVQLVALDPLRPVSLRDGLEGGSSEQVTARLRRTGDASAQAGTSVVRVRATALDGAPGGAPAQAQVRWTPGQTEASVSLPVPMPAAGESAAGASSALVGEIDRDSVEGDNLFIRPVSVREELRVAVVDRRRFGGPPRADRLDPGDWLRLALRPSQAAPIEIVDVEPAAIDAPTLAGLDAVVLTRPDLVESDGWTRLRRFVDGGGLLVVFPPAEASVHLWTDAFTGSMGLPWRIAREASGHAPAIGLAAEQPRTSLLALVHDELKSLVAPVSVSRTLPIEQTGAGAETLMTLSTGDPFLIAQAPVPAGGGASGAASGERGLVVLAASAPAWSWTDLPAKPLMLPLVQEVVRQGVGRAHGSWSGVAGSRLTASAPGRAVELRPVDLGGAGASEAIGLDESGRTIVATRRAGLYRAVDARGAARGLVAVNADGAAGRTDAQAASVIQAWLAPVAGPASFAWLERAEGSGFGASFAAASDERGSPFSLPFLIAALAIAFMEMWMARWFSHARAESGGGAAAPALAGVGT